MTIFDEFQWVVYNPYPQYRKQFEERLVSIWGLSFKRRRFDCHGTGFITSSGLDTDGKKSATIITSAHVVVNALNKHRPESIREQSNPFSPPVAKYFSPLLKGKELFILRGSEVQPRANTEPLTIHTVAIIEEIDLCVILAGRADKQTDYEQFAINSDPLAVGTRVAIAGYPQMHDPMLQPHQFETNGKESLERDVSHKLVIRIGKITKVEDKLRHKRVFGYETNIPMPPGMSGAPMFAFDENNHSTLDVVGICMSDATTPEGMNDTKADGSSFVVGAQNLWCLPMPSKHIIDAWQKRREGQPPFGQFFQDRGRRIRELSVMVDSAPPSVVRTSG
jgi:hypothetical protein